MKEDIQLAAPDEDVEEVEEEPEEGEGGVPEAEK